MVNHFLACKHKIAFNDGEKYCNEEKNLKRECGRERERERDGKMCVGIKHSKPGFKT